MISAAHCFQEKNEEDIRRANRVVLFVGKHDLENLDELDYQEVAARKFEIHPDWDIRQSKYDADIAIIITKTYIEYNQWVRPICLWTENNSDLELIKDKVGSIVGWGKTDAVNCLNYN